MRYPIQNTDGGTEAHGVFNSNGSVQLYHNANERITTTDDGADFGGTGSIRVPNGTTGQRNSSPQVLVISDIILLQVSLKVTLMNGVTLVDLVV